MSLYPRDHAWAEPDRPAVIMTDSARVLTYGQLEKRANQGSHLFRALGLQAGDVIAVLIENSPALFEIAWAAQRSGLYLTCISTRLNPEEIEYIVRDAGAKAIVVSPNAGPRLEHVGYRLADLRLFVVNGNAPGFDSFEERRDAMPIQPVMDESAGEDMLYSSGTTGRPKGVKPRLSGLSAEAPPPLLGLAKRLFGFSGASIYLSPSPLYHAAPLRFAMIIHRLGGTVVQMEKFDAEEALKAIDRHHCDSGQFVPTHFVRMLRLPEEVRERYHVSSMKVAIHAAAPCPVSVKKKMIEWWGPIVHEYYTGTEAIGMTYIGPQNWLEHKGSVGQAVLGEIRICGEDGEPVPVGEEGVVYFANGPALDYHNAPEKAQENTNRHGWTTIGDVGRIDHDGYLYLTDRKSFVIISGGVNIYPQEIENTLLEHSAVADVAVVGAPDDEMGEKVVAVVQPLDWESANDVFRNALVQFVRARLSHVKAPKSIFFMRELPRQPTGKLFKRLVRDVLWDRPGAILEHPLV